MSKYSRIQIVFVFAFGLSVVMGVSYFSNLKIPIFAPLLFLVMAIKDFYDFIKWYLALSGCFPDDMKSFNKQIEALKKKTKLNS